MRIFAAGTVLIWAVSCALPGDAAAQYVPGGGGRAQTPAEIAPAPARGSKSAPRMAPSRSPVAPATDMSPLTPSQANKARPYRHPQRKFSVIVPKGARLLQRGKSGDLLIQSRKGYVISIQTDDANSSISLKEMVSKLESQELGQGKRWTRKIGERFFKFSGLSAFEGIYEGSNTRVRVVVARGRKTDFVFMFVASPKQFSVLVSDFELVLLNFRPGPEDLPNIPKSVMTKPPVNPLSADKPQVSLQQFAEREYGYSLYFPADWMEVKSDPFTVIFSGRRGTEGYYATVGVQNLNPPDAKGPRDAVSRVAAGLKSEIKGATKNPKVFGEKAFFYQAGSVRLEGQQFTATYALNGRPFKKWSVVVPRPVGRIVHVWTYTAPQAIFDKYWPVAETIYRSWVISPPKG